MTDKDLIKNIKKLSKVQPSQEWLSFTRHNLLNRAKLSDNTNFCQEKVLGFWGWFKQYQAFALVGCLLINMIIGPWLIAKASSSSLPGELLYSIKKAAEGVQTKVVSKENAVELQVEFANRRLDELNKIVDKSETKQVVSDFKNNLAGASFYLKNNISKEKAVVVAKQTKKIKQDLIQAKKEAPEEMQADLAEAEQSIEDIKFQILAVLMEGEENEAEATSTDKEILIFLRGEGEVASTTPECDLIK